jgi:hypothetical protein
VDHLKVKLSAKALQKIVFVCAGADVLAAYRAALAEP